MFVLPELLELVLVVIWLLSSVWQDYPSYQTDIDAIEYNSMCNLREQIFQMFHEWKRKEGSGATTAHLLAAIKDAELQELLRILREKGFVVPSLRGMTLSLY